MSEINPREQNQEDINVQRAFRVAIIYTIVALSSVGLAIFLIIRAPVWQVFLMAGISMISFLLDLAAVIWLRRGQPALALKVMYWSGLFTVPLNVLLFIGVASFLAGIVLVTGLVNVFYLFPKNWRNRFSYQAWPVVAAILMFIVDYINLPIRIDLGNTSGSFGPAVLVFIIISVFISVLRQAYLGNIRTKLLVAFIGVTVVATSVLAVYVYTTTNNILQRGLEGELTKHVDGVAVSVGNLLNEEVNTLTTLSLNEVLWGTVKRQNNSYSGSARDIQATLDAKDETWRAAVEADNNADFLVQWHLTNAVAQELIEFQRTFPFNVEVFITDVYGGLGGATNRTSDYYQADEDWWQAAYNNGQGAIYISEPEFDESAGALAVLIAMPLRNRDTGEIAGILRTTYLLSALESTLAELVGETGKTDLYFPGEIVSYFHEGLYTPVEPGEFEVLQAVADQGMIEMEYEGIPSVIIQTSVHTLASNPTVDNLGWTVVFHQQQDEAFSPVNKQVQGTLLVMVVVIIFAVAAAFAISIYLVRPIIQLTRMAEEVSAGNLNSRAEITSSDEIGILASTFNTMTSQLQETLGTLEQQVADRTRALETSTEVSRRLSTILDQDQLVREVVEELQSAFGYYHAQIYLYDEAKQNLAMAGGTGEAGRTMLARGHKIEKGRGLVGRAAQTNQVILVPDVSQAEGWLPNPLLPETKAEVAVPIAIGPNVLGVLDVQHNIINGLSEQDTDLIQAIANQVGIAVQNAQIYQRAQRQATREASIVAISQRIQSASTIDEVLKVAVSELGEALGARRSNIDLKVSAAFRDER